MFDATAAVGQWPSICFRFQVIDPDHYDVSLMSNTSMSVYLSVSLHACLTFEITVKPLSTQRLLK